MTHRSKFVSAAAAYLAVTFLSAFGWHVVLFSDVYRAAGVRGEPMFALGIGAILIQAVVVAHLYPRLSGTGTAASEGLKFGLLLGLLMGSYGALAEAAKFDVGSVASWVFYEGIYFVLQFALAGIAVGLVYGSRRSQEA